MEITFYLVGYVTFVVRSRTDEGRARIYPLSKRAKSSTCPRRVSRSSSSPTSIRTNSLVSRCPHRIAQSTRGGVDWSRAHPHYADPLLVRRPPSPSISPDITCSYRVHLWMVTVLYCLSLPFQIWKTMGWLTIPATTLLVRTSLLAPSRPCSCTAECDILRLPRSWWRDRE